MTWAIVAACAALLSCQNMVVQALSVDILPGREHCVRLEAIAGGGAIQSSFAIVNSALAPGEGARLKFTITRPDESVEHSSSNTAFGKYTFDATMDGVYTSCLLNAAPEARRVSFDFSKGQNVLQLSDAAKKKDLEPVEAELFQIELETDEIFKEIHVQRDKEENFREINDGISSKIMLYSVLSMIIMIASALWQVCHLKGFLHHIKVL